MYSYTAMRTIKSDSLGHAHEQVIEHILKNGYLINTEDGEATIETGVTGLYIENPLNKPTFSNKSKYKLGFLERYKQDLLYGSKNEFHYDYHGRLTKWGCGVDSSGNSIEIDQINYIIEKLRKTKYSRRAIAITWNPPIDNVKKDVPCLQLIQFIIRSNKLNMISIFRSNDMLSAAGPNMYALVGLQQYIAERIGCNVGSYTHISNVPHIYYIRDLDDIESFCGKGKNYKPSDIVCNACKKCGDKS